MKPYGKARTILTEMFRALGNTVNPLISIPGTLLPAWFAACREPVPRRLSLRRPAMPLDD